MGPEEEESLGGENCNIVRLHPVKSYHCHLRYYVVLGLEKLILSKCAKSHGVLAILLLPCLHFSKECVWCSKSFSQILSQL